MICRSLLRRTIFAAIVAITAPWSISADDDSLKLGVAGKRERLEVAIDVRHGDQSIRDVWDATFAEIHRFFDRDGNGTLDRREAARLPPPFALRQLLWGQFALEFETGRGSAGPKIGDGEPMTPSDTAAFYRAGGLGDAIVAAGRTTAAEPLNGALVRHLDADGDGGLSEVELGQAATMLFKLDANGDELIGPGELNPRVTSYPGAAGTVLAAANLSTTGLRLIPPVDDDFDSRSPRIKAHVVVELRSDAEDRWSTFEADDVQLLLRRDRGRLSERTREMQSIASGWFDRLDVDRDASVDDDEAGGPQRAAFERCRAVADRNEDGRLSRTEHTAWIELQTKIADAHCLISVIDFDRGLFELLDVDHNGGLSMRELRSALHRVAESDCSVAGRVDLSRLPRILLATVSHGHPHSPLALRAHDGPAWFQALDRNGDGDLARSEFPFTAADFDRLDADGDGLLSTLEAKPK